jgi:hypothetical protein
MNRLDILPMLANQRTAFAEIWIPWLSDTMKRIPEGEDLVIMADPAVYYREHGGAGRNVGAGTNGSSYDEAGVKRSCSWLKWPEWQFGRELDLLHRNLRLHVPNSFDAREMFRLKAPVGVQIGRHHPEEKITVSRHDLALDYFRHLADLLDEPIHSFLVLPSEPNPGEDGKP